MTKGIRDLRREALENAQKQLAAQYEAALMQSVTAVDAVVQEKGRQQTTLIEGQMAEIQRQLDEWVLAAPNPASSRDLGRDASRVHDLLLARIHKIDFRQVERAVRDLLDADADAGRAALLMFRRCDELAGRLCAARIREILKAETDSGKFQYKSIPFRPGDRNSADALLRRLAGHLGLDIADLSHSEQLDLITTTLCGSLQPGSIVLLDIGDCDYLTHDDPASLQWVITEFWQKLLADLKSAVHRLPGTVTVMALLFFDGDLPDGALADEQCCCAHDFERERLLEIELKPWTRREVEDWLTRWGLPESYSVEKTRLLAEIIMDVTGGSPTQIENQLLRRCAAV